MALDGLNQQMDGLSLKLESAEELIRNRKLFPPIHLDFSFSERILKFRMYG